MIWEPPPLWLPPKPAIIRPYERPKQANMLPGWFPGVISAPPATITFIAAPIDTANLSTYTYSVNLGASGLYTTIFVGTYGDSPGASTGVTVAGNAAALKIAGNNGGNSAEIYAIAYSAGGTQNIVVTYGGGASRAGIIVWGSTLLQSLTAISTGTDSTNPHSISVNIPAGGIALVMAGTGANTSGTALGVTENADVTIESNATQWGGSIASAGGAAGLSVGVTFGSVGNPMAVAASFR